VVDREDQCIMILTGNIFSNLGPIYLFSQLKNSF